MSTKSQFCTYFSTHNYSLASFWSFGQTSKLTPRGTIICLGRTQDPTPNMHAENPNADGRTRTGKLAELATPRTPAQCSGVATAKANKALIAYPTRSNPQGFSPAKAKSLDFFKQQQNQTPNFSSGTPPPPRGRSDHRRGGDGREEHATEIGGRRERDWRRGRGGRERLHETRQGRRRRRRGAEEGLINEPSTQEAEERAV